ncbi:hypothetical protein B0H63DRAFT_563989 [Podospora didyma]|uniref:CFEM domain-containing protein n=1 Tax=Podospora didyma TaxID=330526 RepID=A0AAE0KAK3_9PEZI|nr:hypothetical protein B0H63DRAFT_563989 [Podospora didyma]
MRTGIHIFTALALMRLAAAAELSSAEICQDFCTTSSFIRNLPMPNCGSNHADFWKCICQQEQFNVAFACCYKVNCGNKSDYDESMDKMKKSCTGYGAPIKLPEILTCADASTTFVVPLTASVTRIAEMVTPSFAGPGTRTTAKGDLTSSSPTPVTVGTSSGTPAVSSSTVAPQLAEMKKLSGGGKVGVGAGVAVLAAMGHFV